MFDGDAGCIDDVKDPVQAIAVNDGLCRSGADNLKGTAVDDIQVASRGGVFSRRTNAQEVMVLTGSDNDGIHSRCGSGCA
jgi:hypothetical protein